MTLEYEQLLEDMKMSETRTKAEKPREKVRGTATFIRIGGMVQDFEFRGSIPGTPVQKNVRKLGNSSFYETEGARESSYICHLKVSKASADPAAEMFELLEDLTKPLQKKSPRKPRGKRLLERPDLTVYHNKKESEVTVLMTIDLEGEGEISAKLFNLTSEVNKCFAINQKSLTHRA